MREAIRTLLWLTAVVLVVACQHKLGFQRQPPSAPAPAPQTVQQPERPEKPEPQEEPERKPDPKPVVSTAMVMAVGDILLHHTVYQDAEQKDGSYRFEPMFEQVKTYLRSADLAIVNQETVIGGKELGLSGYPLFNSPVEIGDALKDAGFHAVTMANNHILDRGEAGIRNAIQHWRKLGMTYAGAYESADDRGTPRLLEKKGIVFSLLAYTYGTNGLPIPEGKPYLVNLIEREQIRRDVAVVRDKSDVIIAAIHFGEEYERMPNRAQKELVKELAELGVDIVIGSHPHVLQPPAWVERSDGRRTFVMYSMGNFLSAQDELYRLIGGVMGIQVRKTAAPGQKPLIELLQPTFLPTYNYYRNWRTYRIIPMHRLDADLLPQADKHYDEIKRHMRSFIPDLTIPEPPA